MEAKKKRLTLDLDPALQRRLKTECVRRSLRRRLEAFPEEK